VTRALVHLGLAGLILGLAPGSAPTPEPIGFAENEATVRVGFLHWEADRYQHEWRKIWGFGRHLRADNISSALVDERGLLWSGSERARWLPYPAEEEALLESFRRFDVLVLSDLGGDRGVMGPVFFDDRVRRNLPEARRVLERYVREGGGLLLLPQGSRYPLEESEAIASALLEGFGLEIFPEAIYDAEHLFTHPATAHWKSEQFFYTEEVAPHPVTDGVERLYLLALHPSDGLDKAGSIAIGLSEEWQVVVRGESSAKTHPVDSTQRVLLGESGSYESAPPIAALRSYGKGRIFVLSSRQSHLFLNYGKPVWPNVVEGRGEGRDGRRSHTLKLAVQAMRWLAEPALANPDYGSYTPPADAPVRFPKSIEIDSWRFSQPSRGVSGVVGAHSAYSDGSASVAEWAKAAKQAGLSFIVFSDPLDQLDAEELESLQRDAAAASTEDFFVCPGVEFRDSLGVGWASFGSRIQFPPDELEMGKGRFPYWDGETLYATGAYSFDNRFAANGLLGTDALRSAGGHAANLWWFYRFFPWIYEGDELVEDDVEGWKFALRDLRWLSPVSFTRIRSPEEVPAAARSLRTVLPDLAAVRAWCESRGSNVRQGYVTQGPEILLWEIHSGSSRPVPQHETAGQQRTALRFVVESGVGIDEVIVHHADFGAARRFLGGGATRVEKEFEIAFDRQRYLFLEVVDSLGRRAISRALYHYANPSGVYRCTDNLNYLGSSTLTMHPDRHQRMALARGFEGVVAPDDTILGIDGAGPPATPRIMGPLRVESAWGPSPSQAHDGERVGVVIDPVLSSSDVSIFEMDASTRIDAPGVDGRPTSNRGAILPHKGPRRYVEHRETSYLLRSRKRYNVAWSHRRTYESAKDYEGGLMWHEGRIRVKEDLPVPLHRIAIPLVELSGVGGAIGTLLDVRDAESGALRFRAGSAAEEDIEGTLGPGGYLLLSASPAGKYAILVGSESPLSYRDLHWQRREGAGTIVVGLSPPGGERSYPAGTELRYSFLVATLPGNELHTAAAASDVARSYNLDGGIDGYPFELEVGRFVDAEFFFRAEAIDHEMTGRFGPRSMVADLAFRVGGLEDNGCAATWVEGRDFFRFVPVHEGEAWFQEAIDDGIALWVGNVFVADRAEVQLTLVRAGQRAGRKPFLEVHNPGDEAIEVNLRSPEHAPIYGGMEFRDLAVPAGDSVRIQLPR